MIHPYMLSFNLGLLLIRIDLVNCDISIIILGKNSSFCGRPQCVSTKKRVRLLFVSLPKNGITMKDLSQQQSEKREKGKKIGFRSSNRISVDVPNLANVASSVLVI